MNRVNFNLFKNSGLFSKQRLPLHFAKRLFADKSVLITGGGLREKMAETY